MRDCAEEVREAADREATAWRGQGGVDVEIGEELGELVDAWPPRTVHDDDAAVVMVAEERDEDRAAAAAAAAAAARSREPPEGMFLDARPKAGSALKRFSL